MINFNSSVRIIGSLSVVIPTTILAAGLLALLPTNDDIYVANAQVVDMDEPPTNDTEELDVKIDATEPLPVNGTIVVDISEADDIDIDAIPPEGVSILVTNTTLTVTNNPVEVSEASGTSPNETEGLGVENPVGNDESDVEESSDNDAGDGDEEGDEGEEPTE